jgi:hypothetical protein
MLSFLLRRDAQDVKKVLERMKALGVEPNEITFMDLLEIYKEKGDVWRCLFWACSPASNSSACSALSGSMPWLPLRVLFPRPALVVTRSFRFLARCADG